MPAQVGDTVYVLTIEHKHGSNTTVHLTEKGAWDELASYCDEEWENEIPDAPKPEEKDDKLINQYFEAIDWTETYTVESADIQI